MSLPLARALIASEAASERAVGRALFVHATQQLPFVQTLLATGTVDEATLQRVTDDGGVAATVVVPATGLTERLPAGMCARLLAVPVGRNEVSGAVTVAVADTRDTHPAAEIGYFLHARVELLRATVAALRLAVDKLQAEEVRVERPEPPRDPPAHGERSRTPIWGTPVVSVVPPPAPHIAPDMPIPLLRRSVAPNPIEDTVLELRRPSRRPTPEPDTQRDPLAALRTVQKRPALVMIAETPVGVALGEARVHSAVTIPAPKEDPRHTMLTAPAPPRRSELPPSVTVPRSTHPMAVGPLPMPDAAPVLAAMAEANDRDAIIALLISGMRTSARRVAIMAVRREAFAGWSCNAEFGDARVWRSVQVSTGLPSVLATAASGTPYLGPLFRTDGHAPLLAFMKEATRDVAVYGVRVDMLPVLVLLADDLADTALGTKRMGELAKAATAGLARVLRKANR